MAGQGSFSSCLRCYATPGKVGVSLTGSWRGPSRPTCRSALRFGWRRPSFWRCRYVPPRRRSTPIRAALTSLASLRPCGFPRTVCAPGSPSGVLTARERIPRRNGTTGAHCCGPGGGASSRKPSNDPVHGRRQAIKNGPGSCCGRALLASKGVLDDPLPGRCLRRPWERWSGSWSMGPLDLDTVGNSCGLAARVRWFDSQVVSACTMASNRSL